MSNVNKIFIISFSILVILMLVLTWLSNGLRGKIIQNSAKLPPQSGREPTQYHGLSMGPSSNVSEWKTYRNDQYRFEVKYPPIYYIKTLMNSTAWLGWKNPAFTLTLSEVDPGGPGVKATRNPNIYIDIFEQTTTAQVLEFLRSQYSNVTLRELSFGKNKFMLIVWDQQDGLENQSIFIKGSQFLYCIGADYYNSQLTQDILNKFLLNFKLL